MRVLAVIVIGSMAIGCTANKKLAEQEARIAELEGELSRKNALLEAGTERARRLNAELENALAEYQEKEQVWLEQRNQESVLTVSEAVLFGSGNADFTPQGRDIIDRVAQVAKQNSDRVVRIEGHTDNKPIGESIKAKFPSNWELAASRACTVVRYLYWQHKIDGNRLTAMGYGEHRPIATNDTKEGRAKNRRVVIVVGPREN